VDWGANLPSQRCGTIAASARISAALCGVPGASTILTSRFHSSICRAWTHASRLQHQGERLAEENLASACGLEENKLRPTEQAAMWIARAVLGGWLRDREC